MKSRQVAHCHDLCDKSKDPHTEATSPLRPKNRADGAGSKGCLAPAHPSPMSVFIFFFSAGLDDGRAGENKVRRVGGGGDRQG